jgi:outer membrane immunogenic protein
MHRILVAVLGVTAVGVAAASAADLPLKAPPAPFVPRFSWTGCYIGGHVGAGLARTDWTNTFNGTATGDLLPGDSFSESDTGFVGGGQLGCNYQIDQWVLGLEGTFAGSTIQHDFANNIFGGADDIFSAEINSIATVTGRLGYALDTWLLYIKGGYAGADVDFSFSDPSVSGGESNWHNGWTVGGGVEYALTPNWILGLEYNYINLETKSHELGAGLGGYTFDVDPRIQEVLARVSYKFW